MLGSQHLRRDHEREPPLSIVRTVTRPLRASLSRITGRERRIWSTEGRTHLEYRPVDDDTAAAFAERVHDVFGRDPLVDWVEVNPWTHRVVVGHDPVVPRSDLVGMLEQAEREAGAAEHPFPLDRPDHPADVEPLVAEAIQLVSDALGATASISGRLLRLSPPRFRADVAWLATLLENVPQLRGVLEERLGPRATDLVLGVTNSVLRGVSYGLSGHVVDAVSRTNRIRSLRSVRRGWAERSAELYPGSDVPDGAVPERAARPVPLPPGPIERYAEEAWPVSLGGFATSLLVTDDVQRSAAPLLDGIPKAARLGRRAFASQLTRVLADRGILVLRPDALDALDRVDTVVVEAELVTDPATGGLSEEGRTLLDGIRRAGTTLILLRTRRADEETIDEATDDLGGISVVAASHIGEHVTAAQVEGAVVAVVATAGTPGLAVADVAIGVDADDDRPPAWEADVLCRRELADAYLVVRACAAARRASQQSVTLAVAGAGIGATTGLGGLRRDTGRRVLQVVDTAALLAIGNGVRLASGLAGTPRTLHRDRIPWHRLELDAVLARLEVGVDHGLDPDEVERRATTEKAETAGRVRRYGRAVAEELANPLTPVLFAGAGLSLATGGLADAGLVTTVVGLNAAVGGAQRYRAEQELADLHAAGSHPTRVRRGGEERTIPAAELVRGDVVLLEAGEAVPADLRIVEASNLEVDESGLTGESVPVTKDAAPSEAAPVAERSSMLYQGTSVAAGTAVGVVVAVGAETESRRALQWAVSEDTAPTGVEARLEQLTQLTIPMAILSGAGVSLTGLLRGVRTRELVDTSIGLAVAAVPEGLPLLANAAQRAAARRLGSHRVLVRDARAIEALGRVDVLCADKTGTLTEGRLRLTTVSDGLSDVPAGEGNGSHERALLTARRATPIDPTGTPLPHPTDEAVAVGTADLGVEREAGGVFDILDDLPFEPGRSYHAVLADTPDGRLLAVKGAPESVIERCDRWERPDETAALTDDIQALLLDEAERLAAQGLRVLAVAERPEEGEHVTDDDVTGLAFVGFVGLRDPVRPVSAESIARLRDAGVDVVMITGDHPTTARSIADELGLSSGVVLTGPDIDAMDDDELDQHLPKVTVFARVTPEHKVRIVRRFQALGRTVAMTGDGANDAPAIRLADVGIAVGKRATAAARETADVVIVDDKLEVIVDAIAEGRGLWGSVRDAVAVLVGGNLGEIGYTLLGSMVGRRPPLDTRQLLLVNLVTDVGPAMALAIRQPASSIEERLAEGPNTSLGGALNQALVWRGAGTAVGATTAFAAARLTGTGRRARTAGLVALVGAQLGQTIASSEGDWRVVATGVGSAVGLAATIQTPGVSQFVGCRPMGPVGWATGLFGAAVGTAVGMAGPRLERLVGREDWSAGVVDRLSELAPTIPGILEPAAGPAGTAASAAA
jgi:cation-transporting ATPase I